MRTSIVLGLGFGDEGKGLVTAHLASKDDKSLVVRFSGGHQAGHTVIRNGFRHVFSQFGSGTLHGAATYWSKHCTFDPVAFVAEHELLTAAGFTPEIYVDRLAPVTTFYDIFYNRAVEEYNRHGSVGVGFAATVERHTGPVKLYVQDLHHIQILKRKLKEIRAYYQDKVRSAPPAIGRYYEGVHELEAMEVFLRSAYILSGISLVTEREILQSAAYDHIVFEGSQGIMLDMDHGLFPNVTRSSTTSRNAMQLISDNDLPAPEIYYVTRSYTTRHGNGWMPNDDLETSLKITVNPEETNRQNEWQGKLRISMLDMDTLNYALHADSNYSHDIRRNLVITCMDQVVKFQVTNYGKVHDINELSDLVPLIDFHLELVYVSSSPDPDRLSVAAPDLTAAE